VAGVACITVAPTLFQVQQQYESVDDFSRSAMTTLAPTANGRYNSSCDVERNRGYGQQHIVVCEPGSRAIDVRS